MDDKHCDRQILSELWMQDLLVIWHFIRALNRTLTWEPHTLLPHWYSSYSYCLVWCVQQYKVGLAMRYASIFLKRAVLISLISFTFSSSLGTPGRVSKWTTELQTLPPFAFGVYLSSYEQEDTFFPSNPPSTWL